MKNKYRAKAVFYSHSLYRALTEHEIKIYQTCVNNPYGVITKFDSKLEFKVFQVLQNCPLVSDIIPHHQIRLIPKNSSSIFPNGKTWKVDFLVQGKQDKPLFLVEAKGIISRDFPFLLNLLEQNQPELFNKLWLVFNDKIPTSKLLVKNLRKSKSSLKLVTLKEFQQKLLS